MPSEALYLGLAEDGLPVLLNLFDPTPGPLLITGDQGSGKTVLLKMITRAAEIMHPSAEVQYCVLTQHIQEWTAFEESKQNVGIYPVQQEAASALLESLVSWAHTNHGEQQSILLLVDSLFEVVKLGGLTEQNLRWLLLRGPSRRVWPIITLNSADAAHLSEWLAFFRTRLFGQTSDLSRAHTLTGNSHFKLDGLIAGSQFALRENNSLLKFWAPLLN